MNISVNAQRKPTMQAIVLVNIFKKHMYIFCNLQKNRHRLICNMRTHILPGIIKNSLITYFFNILFI